MVTHMDDNHWLENGRLLFLPSVFIASIRGQPLPSALPTYAACASGYRTKVCHASSKVKKFVSIMESTRDPFYKQ